MGKTNIRTGIKGVEVRLTWPEHQAPVTVSGHAIDKNGYQIDKTPIVKRTADDIEDLEHVKDQVVAAVIKAYKNKYEKPEEPKNMIIPVNGLDEDTEMVKAFREIEYKVFNEHYFFVPQWDSIRTYDTYMTYFRGHILPKVQYFSHTEQFTAVELNDLREEIKKLSLENKKSHGIETNADTGAVHKLNAADKIYAEMRSYHPDLPKLGFALNETSSILKRQQIKSLPTVIHLEFRKKVEAKIYQEPFKARGAILMDSGALRSSEAAASWQGLYEDYGDYIVVWVLKQEYAGMRIDRLKRPASYRCVVLDEWGTKMLREVNEIIGEEVDNDYSAVTESQLSSWVKELLIDSGCTKEYITEAYDNMLKHLEYDKKGQPIKDVTAYILRRNRASIWRNYCGYSQDELDYYLGHRIYKSRFELNNPQWKETQMNIALKNSRYDMFKDISLNPKHNAIKMHLNEEHTIIPFTEYVIENDSSEPAYCFVNLRAAEAGEPIDVIVENDIGLILNLNSTNFAGKRINSEIIEELKLKEE